MSDTKCKFRGFPNHPGVQSFTRTHRTSEGCYTHGCVYYGERIQVKSSQGKKHIVQNGEGGRFQKQNFYCPLPMLVESWRITLLTSTCGNKHRILPTKKNQESSSKLWCQCFSWDSIMHTWLIDWLIDCHMVDFSLQANSPSHISHGWPYWYGQPQPMSTG